MMPLKNSLYAAVLEVMVGFYFKKLSANASPGFQVIQVDGIPIPFLKCACLPIERGHTVDNVNVLVPR
eukprot:319927-Pelagomonas_calceolata.AAC.1